MDNDDDIVDKEIVVTLLSNGSSNLFKDNSLTLFSNKLHAPINLNPSNYNYIALQEVGISLNSSNIRIPNEKPAIIYFEWDKTFNKQSEDLSKYHIAKKFLSLLMKIISRHFSVSFQTNSESTRVKLILIAEYIIQILLKKN